MKFEIIRRSKLWFVISTVLIAVGLFSMLTRGFNLGIDFAGGAILDLRFEQAVTVSQVRDALKAQNLENSTIQLAGETSAGKSRNVFVRTHALEDETRRAVMADLQQQLGAFDVLRVEKVGAVIGEELTRQALLAMVISWILMIMYITFRFEFRFAVSGVAALVHDLLIVLGAFSLFQLEIDSAFVAALLTIIGYSINDTIVIFDRIRENMKSRRRSEPLGEMVDRSIWQTMTRSIYTVMTVLFVTAALYWFGGDTTKNFSLALLIGFIAGAYSSIFIASPIWVWWRTARP